MKFKFCHYFKRYCKLNLKTLPTKKIKFKKTAVEKLVQSLDFLFCFKALIAFWQKCCETEIFCVFQNHGKSLS